MQDRVEGTRSVVAWRWIVLLLALSQLAAPSVTKALAGDFLKSGATNEALITPSGYAFGLWGVICVLSAVTAAAIARYGLGTWWESSVLIDASIVFIGFSVWLVIAAQDWLWVSVAVFAVMAGALIQVVRRLVRHRSELTCPSWVATLATVTFGLYLGWSSIAVFANVTAALISSGWSASGVAWQFVMLVLAASAAVGLTVILRGTPGYVAGVLWALIAIAIGSAQRGSTALSAVAVVCAAVIVVSAVVMWRQFTRAGSTRSPDAQQASAARRA
jgi:hypothetical protein